MEPIPQDSRADARFTYDHSEGEPCPGRKVEMGGRRTLVDRGTKLDDSTITVTVLVQLQQLVQVDSKPLFRRPILKILANPVMKVFRRGKHHGVDRGSQLLVQFGGPPCGLGSAI